MSLSIIGAGFGRTGTESLKKALEILGFGPCYHMFEVLPHPERVEMWRAAARGEVPNWDDAFSGYRSTVDWPAAFFWRELSEHFPKAKIILSVRDAESWYESMDNTILRGLRDSTDQNSVGLKMIANGVFGGEINDRDHIIATYEANIREVQSAFSSDRLLTLELGSGWEPLCQFLECPIPQDPFPSSNSSEGFASRVATARKPTST